MIDNTSSAALSRQTNVIAHSREIFDETPALSYALTAPLTHTEECGCLIWRLNNNLLCMPITSSIEYALHDARARAGNRGILAGTLNWKQALAQVFLSYSMA